MNERPRPGTVGWIDLTAEAAEPLRDFYGAVVGWNAQGHDMGAYEDFVMTTPAGDAAFGICHRRGGNADVPTGWVIYIVVEDLDRALAACRAGGGAVLGDV